MSDDVLINGHRLPKSSVNPSVHKFLGMFREPYRIPKGYVVCSCGRMLSAIPDIREHWQSGHFDIPQYVNIE